MTSIDPSIGGATTYVPLRPTVRGSMVAACRSTSTAARASWPHAESRGRRPVCTAVPDTRTDELRLASASVAKTISWVTLSTKEPAEVGTESGTPVS